MKIKACKNCSNFKKKKLKKHAKKASAKLKFGCIGKCLKKNPKLEGKYFGRIDDTFVVCDSKKEFYQEIHKAAKK